jgi:PhnB protein
MEREEVMNIAPYLHFPGTCAEAFALYEKTLGGKITFRSTFGESQMKDSVGPEWHQKIMHITLTIGDRVIMGSDAPPAHFAKPQGFGVSIEAADYADAERIFTALSEDGNIAMPFQKTFWSPGFGMATDRFGVPWMIGVATAM